MTKHRPGHHDLFAQIPDVLWKPLLAEADEQGISIAKLLGEVLRSRYDIPLDKIPKPRRAGRKPKKR